MIHFNNFKLISLLSLIALSLCNTLYAGTPDIGGKVELRTGLNYIDSKFYGNFWSLGEIEFFLPENSLFEPRLMLQSTLTDKDSDTAIKYLYARHHMNQAHLTIGRQPVFWSYGAMLNLMDFGTGVDNLAGTSFRTGIDGLRYHHNLGSGRSLQLVTSFDSTRSLSNNKTGYGMRLRMPASGYDLSFNFFNQPVFMGMGNQLERLLRGGATYNIDMGSFNTYGAIGYYRLKDSSTSDYLIQVGFDTSRIVSAHRTLIIKGEYYRFINSRFDASLLTRLMLGGKNLDNRLQSGGNADSLQTAGSMLRRDLLLINFNLQQDFFTNIGLTTMFESSGNTIAVAPYYISELGEGLEMRIDGSVTRLDSNEYISALATSINYYF